MPTAPSARNDRHAVAAQHQGSARQHSAVMAAYEADNAAVRAAIPADWLFEYQPGDGWAPLCATLALPEPDDPFPHTNTRKECRERAGMDDR